MTAAEASLLARIAERAMLERGFLAYPPPPALAEAESRRTAQNARGARDLCGLPWTSIDNPESRDLDQIEAVEKVDGGIRLYVGVADVERYVPRASAVDAFAAHNTTSVYTGVRTFSMLPERLSFDLSSLLAGERRLAVIIETSLSPDGQAADARIYPAWVKNRAKLDYPSVSAWLEGKAPPPAPLVEAPELKAQIAAQDQLAQSLANGRKRAGALDVDTAEARLVLEEGVVTGLAADSRDRAGGIIEEFMILSNSAVARELDKRGLPSIRRVVKEPERWARIAAYAKERGGDLPATPSALELSRFVEKMRETRPEQFAEISLSLIKLIGRGEYAAHRPGDREIGHFGLATAAYAHSTAPNRRYVDLTAQRILKGAHAYGMAELSALAAHCTAQESAAQKVERRVHKSAAALLLKPRVGEAFNGVITGAGEKGTFARLLELPIEGKVILGEKGLRVGDKVRVKLHDVSVEKGFIDFQVV